MTQQTKQLFLFTTTGCHLCELAIEQLEPLLEPLALSLVEVEIADNEAYLEAYGTRIPVIRLDNREEDLGWPFDTQLAYEFLKSKI